MTDYKKIDELADAAKLKLTDEEKERAARAIEDLCRLAEKLEPAVPTQADNRQVSEKELREDTVRPSAASPKELLALSADTRDGYVAVPITV